MLRAVPLLALLATGLLPVPPLTGPVVDEAGVLSSDDRQALEALARATRWAQADNGVQLGFLLVPSLEGEPIEDFSIRVAEAWKLGTKGADNGLLFVVSRDDHRMRIEVGGGLEGRLPDVVAGRIVDQTLKPAFREGRFGPGLLAGALQALALARAVPPGPSAGPRRVSRPPPDPSLWPLVLMGLGLLFPLALFFFLAVRDARRRGKSFAELMRESDPGVRWSDGGSTSGGDGSWSGGGGGFSGGGASGSW